MSNKERSRHLNQFIAESEPPPMAQHLPPLPSASQRFASIQQQQLAAGQMAVAQQRNQSINYIDPFSQNSSNRQFDPFQSLVMQKQTQDQEEDYSSSSSENDEDEDSSDLTEDTVSTTAENQPTKPIPVFLPKKVPIASKAATFIAPKDQPTVVTQIRQKSNTNTIAPQPPQPPSLPAVTLAPVTTGAVVSLPVASVSTATTAAAAAPTNNLQSVPALVPSAAPAVLDEPQGIMDQSMSFLKKNFWAILTVIVILVSIGVAFIYFARPKANEASNLKKAPEVKAVGPPGGETRWSQIEMNNEIAVSAEEIKKIQQEKQLAEEKNQQLQKRVEEIEQEIQKASQDQKNNLRDIEKLQEMCENLLSEKEQLKDNNMQLAEFITQHNLLPQQQQQPQQQNLETEQLRAEEQDVGESVYQKQPLDVEEKQSLDVEEKQPLDELAPQKDSITKQTLFDNSNAENENDKLDLEEIEKSAVEGQMILETVDNTQIVPERTESNPTQQPQHESLAQNEEEQVTEEKLPWQKN